MKRLYIDFDGVVMDTIPTLYKACEEAGIDMSNEREKSLFFSVYDFGKIINDDYMLNDSINSIKKLVNLNYGQSAYRKDEKSKWIVK